MLILSKLLVKGGMDKLLIPKVEVL